MTNREIKFRAWHIGEEKMCTVSLFRQGVGAFLDELIPEPDQHISDKWYVKGLETGRFCDMAEFHLMQYTGLKDKNGKEIYEGDVVEWKTSPMYGTSRIIFYDGGYRLKDYFADDNLLNKEYAKKCCKIIGNIYEHPELSHTTQKGGEGDASK